MLCLIRLYKYVNSRRQRPSSGYIFLRLLRCRLVWKSFIQGTSSSSSSDDGRQLLLYVEAEHERYYPSNSVLFVSIEGEERERPQILVQCLISSVGEEQEMGL